MVKKVKQKKMIKTFLLLTFSIFPLMGCVGIMLPTKTNSNSISQLTKNKKITFKNTSKKSIENTNIENEITVPTINDTDAETLIIGKNVIHLNNKVIYAPGTANPLVSASLLTVLDENFDKVQEIVLDSSFNKMSPIDANDVSKGIVISGWEKDEAIYYGIDINTQTIDENSKQIVKVPLHAFSVAGNFDIENNGDKAPAIISVSIIDKTTASSTAKVKLIITSIMTKISKEFVINKSVDIAFNSIELVDCISVNNKLYIGINYHQDNKPVGSDIILLVNGNMIPGGPTIKLPFSIKSMVNDDEAKKIYVQYSDINDGSIRLWSYSTINDDKFSQESGGINKETFTQMVSVTPLNSTETSGIITLNSQKNSIKYYAMNNLNNYKYDYDYSFFSANSDKISDIIYNKYTNKFNLFYSYDAYVDGVISWEFDPTITSTNINDERYYTNIAPIHIRYADLVKLMNTDVWKQEYASCYAKNGLKNSYNEFLEIPTYFKKIQAESIKNKDNSFEIKTTSNDNIGTFNLVVNRNEKQKFTTTDPTTNEDHVQTFVKSKNLLDFNVTNFLNINPGDIKANINYSSQLLAKTPTELEAMLNDPQTKELTQEMVFDLFGIDKKFQKLDYNIEIKGYNVLGNIDIEISFPTVFNDTIQKVSKFTNSKLMSTKSEKMLPTYFRSQHVLENTFNASTERWFIPIVTIASIIALSILILIIWLTLGKKLYKAYLEKSKKELLEEYEPLKILTDERDCELEDDYGNIRNPMSLVSTTEINDGLDLKVNFREEDYYFKRIRNN